MFACDECDLTWKNENEFNVHKDQKHKFKCKICKVKFVKESTLKYHSQVWCCNKCGLNFKCDLCGDTFGNERKLRSHRSSYCPECDLVWECAKEFDIHKDQKHKFK